MSFLFFFFFFLMIKIFMIWKKDDKCPPGPRSLPILGDLLYIKNLMNKKKYLSQVYKELADIYGPVMSFKLGTNTRVILVSGRDAVVKMLSQSEFDGRPDAVEYRTRTMGERRGVIFTDGKVWDDSRRFCLKYLNKFGYSKRSMEDLISQNAMTLIKDIEEKIMNNNIVDYFPIITDIAILNNIWHLVFGYVVHGNDESKRQTVKLSSTNSRNSRVFGAIYSHWPILKYILPELSGYKAFKDRQIQMWRFFENKLREHKESRDPEINESLINEYLEKMKLHNDSSISTFNENQLIAIIKDLLIAGMETTNYSLGFAITYLTIKLEIQKKLHQELDEVFGRESLPSLAYKKRLPYLNATIAEVLRISNIGPTTVAHRAITDSTLLGYKIKKNSVMLASLISVNMDQKYWGDPQVFRPERFINENGEFIEDSWSLSFGFGRRRCFGEVFARQTLVLFLAHLLQKFRFDLAPGQSEPCMNGIDGFSVAPPLCKIIITKR